MGAKKGTDAYYEARFNSIRREKGGSAALKFYDQMPREVKDRLRGRLLVMELLRKALKEERKKK